MRAKRTLISNLRLLRQCLLMTFIISPFLSSCSTEWLVAPRDTQAQGVHLPPTTNVYLMTDNGSNTDRETTYTILPRLNFREITDLEHAEMILAVCGEELDKRTYETLRAIESDCSTSFSSRLNVYLLSIDENYQTAYVKEYSLDLSNPGWLSFAISCAHWNEGSEDNEACQRWFSNNRHRDAWLESLTFTQREHFVYNTN